MQTVYKKQCGYTLIELIMVILLLAILATISSVMLSQGFNAFLTAQDVNDADWQGRIATERMIRDIRAVRSSSDITTATSSQFAFSDVTGTSLSYTLSGSSLMLNSNVLANGVSSLTFTYQDANGATTSTISNIRYVSFTITVTQNDANYNLASSIYLRDVV